MSSEVPIKIRATEEQDWMLLKEIRLAALRDTPTAFGKALGSFD
jgi:hypothetical protein